MGGIKSAESAGASLVQVTVPPLSRPTQPGSLIDLLMEKVQIYGRKKE
jgi:hypothetical protein